MLFVIFPCTNTHSLIRCPYLLEENAACRIWGQTGWIQPTNERARYCIIHVGFVVNLIACILTLASCLAIATTYETLSVAAFSQGSITVENLPLSAQTSLEATIDLKLGLRAAAMEIFFLRSSVVRVIPFDEFCDLSDETLELYLQSNGDTDCDSCNSVSKSMVWSVLIAVITFIPSLVTNILRMYSNYDVNCQKFVATGFACVTLILSLNTLVRYNNACFASFYSGPVPYEVTLETIRATLKDSGVINPDAVFGGSIDNEWILEQLDAANSKGNSLLRDARLTPYFDWEIGPGLLCLYLGTLL